MRWKNQQGASPGGLGLASQTSSLYGIIGIDSGNNGEPISNFLGSDV